MLNNKIENVIAVVNQILWTLHPMKYYHFDMFQRWFYFYPVSEVRQFSVERFTLTCFDSLVPPS